MLKDIHLLEAAMVTDWRISSLNELDRERFALLSKSVAEIRDIVWTNPNAQEENCIEWLKKGAPAEAHRKLGYVAGEG
jgi:hypothetical protein